MQDLQLTRACIGLLLSKNVEFYEDSSIEPRFRSRLTDFRASGYDRGHMVHQPASAPDSNLLVTHCWCSADNRHGPAGACGQLQGVTGCYDGYLCVVQYQPAGWQGFNRCARDLDSCSAG